MEKLTKRHACFSALCTPLISPKNEYLFLEGFPYISTRAPTRLHTCKRSQQREDSPCASDQLRYQVPRNALAAERSSPLFPTCPSPKPAKGAGPTCRPSPPTPRRAQEPPLPPLAPRALPARPKVPVPPKPLVPRKVLAPRKALRRKPFRRNRTTILALEQSARHAIKASARFAVRRATPNKTFTYRATSFFKPAFRYLLATQTARSALTPFVHPAL